MINPATYLLYSGTSLVLLYGFYAIFLKKETFFRWNRLFLLSALCISLFGPFMSIGMAFQQENIFIQNILDPILISSGNIEHLTQAPSLTIKQLLIVIYSIGALLLLFRFLFNLAHILLLYSKNEKRYYEGNRIVIMDDERSPFTFFSVLFISRHDLGKAESNELITHERAHLRHYHTLDVLMSEVAVILHWFNPVIWLYRSSIRAEHEYQADREVLSKGFDKLQYQKLMIEKATGIPAFELANHFNYSLLKKRIDMMNVKKSNTISLFKYFLATPLFAFVLLLFMSSAPQTVQAQGDQKEVYEKVDKMPEYPGGNNAMMKFMQQNILYPQEARKHGVMGMVVVEFTVTKSGKVADIHVLKSDMKALDKKELVVVGYKEGEEKVEEVNPEQYMKLLDQEAVRVVGLFPDFTPAENEGKKVNVKMAVPVKFKLQ
ncbi:MAG: M56 family metallopeptidase [Bacteroidetes bacterium]|nr:M56 family metallopeptidase [Bacteroidota bacterium]